VGRFSGSNAKRKANASSSAASAHVSTATNWSVLSERIQGLLCEAALVGTGMEQYCLASSNSEGPAMKAIRDKMMGTNWDLAWQNDETLMAYGEEMSTDPLEAMFLKALSSLKQPKRTLEIGMFVGYGAVAVLEGCDAARVVSLEVDPYLKKWVEDCLKPLPEFRERLQIIEGPALDSLRSLPADQKFDLVFVDANKAEYKEYLETLLKRGLLADGAMIVADNTLYCGMPYTPASFDSQPARREFGDAIRVFNAWVKNHPELKQVILPLRDGVSLITYCPNQAQGEAQKPVARDVREVTFYDAEEASASTLDAMCRSASSAVAAEVDKHSEWTSALKAILRLPAVEVLLLHISRVRVFREGLSAEFASNLKLLEQVKKLKYWYVQPQSTFMRIMAHIAEAVGVSSPKLSELAVAALESGAAGRPRVRVVCKEQGMEKYLRNEEELETREPHAVYPTSTYRSCDGHVLATEDAALIESVMSTTITTTIKIISNVLDPACDALREVYQPLGRAVAVIDERVDELHGDRINAYFTHHSINLTKLCFRGMEADKGFGSVESILRSLKKLGVSRNEPVLIIGGGVIADLGGFATALYHRNTPYVMLCTSIVSGIDAGPSPRTCCDGDGYKNLFGAYHPPVLTLTDRTLFSTLREGWLRHGVAEIIKMAVVKDFSLFELLEDVGPRIVSSKFGTLCPEDTEFCRKCDLIVGKAMHSYVQSEYGNLWETHQCRPHAYGHTWSPGYELPAGMLHGHAVATGMGWGAYLAKRCGFITTQQLERIMWLISDMELSLFHPIMEDSERIFNTQTKIIQKRGGHLCAPVPRGAIGKCGYIQNLSRDDIEQSLKEYKALCTEFPRSGLGIEVHCADVGLEDPGTVGTRKEDAELSKLADENRKLRAALAAAEKRLGMCSHDGDCQHHH